MHMQHLIDPLARRSPFPAFRELEHARETPEVLEPQIRVARQGEVFRTAGSPSVEHELSGLLVL